MSEVLIGKAWGAVELRYDALTRGITAVEQQFNRLRQITAKPIVAQIGAAGGGAAAGRAPALAVPAQLDAAQTRAALSAQRLATEQQRTAVAAQRLSTEEQKTAAAAAQADAAQSRAAASALRLEQAQSRAATGSKSFAREMGDSVKSTLLGVIGPAPLVTASLGAVTVAFNKTTEAVRFKAELDETRQSITTLIGTTRNSSQVFAEASAFGNRYAFTQREIADSLRDSTPLLRSSTSSTSDILANLARLSQLNPAEGIKGAAFALNELVSGDVQSLVERFRVSRTEAYAMRDAIRSGQDPIVVLNDYLIKAGVSMQTLENRTKGTAGLLREAAVASERFSLALGGQAGGAGEGFLKFRTNLLNEFTALLSGDFSQIEARNTARIEAQKAYNEALQQGKTESQAYAISQQVLQQVERERSTNTLQDTNLLELRRGEQQAGTEATYRASAALLEAGFAAQRYGEQTAGATDKAAAHARLLEQSAIAASRDAAAKELDAAKTELLQQRTQAAANAFLLANPLIDESGIKAAIAAGAISPLTGELARLNLELSNTQAQLAGLAMGRPETGGDAIGRFLTGQQKATAFLDQQARLAQQARERQTLAIGSDREKVSLLQKQYDTAVRLFGVESEQAIDAQTRLRQEKERTAAADARSGRSRVTTAQQALNVEERIRDSLESQYKAQFDAAELTIRDRQERRREDQEIRQAQRILASGRASQQFKDAAADRLALIAIEREQRAQAIREKQATAGGTLIGGRIFQSQPSVSGGGIPVGAPGAPAAVGGAPGAPPPGAAPISGGLTIQFVVDGQVIANAIIPNILGAGRSSLARVEAGGGGQQA